MPRMFKKTRFWCLYIFSIYICKIIVETNKFNHFYIWPNKCTFINIPKYYIHLHFSEASNFESEVQSRFDFPVAEDEVTTEVIEDDNAPGHADDSHDVIDGNEDTESIQDVYEDDNDITENPGGMTSILDDKNTMDYVNDLSNNINASATEDAEDVFPYAAVIAGVFGALFVLMLVFGICYQRQTRKRALEADWKEKQDTMKVPWLWHYFLILVQEVKILVQKGISLSLFLQNLTRLENCYSFLKIVQKLKIIPTRM